MLDVLVLDAQGAARAMEEAQVGGINRQIEAVHASANAYRISLAQELSDTKALLAAEWADEQAYYAKLRALDVAAGASTRTADEALEAAHQRYLTKLQKADEKYDAERVARWREFSSAIESSFAGAISGMIQGTQTFAGAMRSILGSMIDGIIQIFVKMAVQWAENMILQKILGKETAASQIVANASVAAVAAMASVAAIPFVGWVMAPGVGAETEAIGLSYLAGLSAAGGFDVPAGVNPLTQLHQREMVLPEKHADVIRGMADQGGAGAHYHLHALDVRSVKQFLSQPANRAAVAAALSTHFSRGGGR
jgi:hypothetical protein